jgi:endonuclease YncB( thermonuclease family)
LDGDTLFVAITSSRSGYTGTQRVRTIGINAPETSPSPQCGGPQAKSLLKALVPEGTPLQLRALAGTSYDADRGRPVRSIYALDEEGNWFDTARQIVSDGMALWFPHRPTLDDNPEWAHNLEYRVLADDARAAGRGLWSANYCGPSPAANLEVSVSWDQSVDGHEKVFIFNRGGSTTSLGGWTLRDSALNMYRFPSYAAVAGNSTIEVRLANGADDPGAGVYYAGDDDWFDNLPADNPYFAGDAAYLMDNAGPYQTGNLRAWAPYPCNPDECADPLKGALTVQTPAAGDWRTGVDLPSAPRQVDLAAGSNRDITVTWQPPTYLGDAVGITQYRVVLSPTGGGTPVTRNLDAPATSTTFTGLPVGSAHSVTVEARNAQGWSTPSAPTGPVTARTAPGAPRNVEGFPLGGAIAARWDEPSSDGGSRVTSYQVTATPQGGGSSGMCTTTDPSESCVITGLTDGTDYLVRVTAGNAAGSSSPSAAVEVDPTAQAPIAGALGAPTDVRTTPLPAAAVVSWDPPTPVVESPVTGYVATAMSGGTPAGSCQVLGGATSCVIPSLADGTTYSVTVSATSGLLTGPASNPAVPVLPASDPRVGSATGVPTPAPAPWGPRETIRITNGTGGSIDLTGYALWDKDPRGATDTPDYVFPRGTVVPASSTLRVRSGSATTAEPASATLHYTGTSAKFLPAGDRIELANLNKAPVSCTAWGGVSCVGQRPTTVSTQPVGVTARTTANAMTVNWGAPVSRGGTTIRGYTATAYDAPNGGNAIGSCSAGGTDRSCTIGGLFNGGRYFADVVATNDVGVSAASAPRVQGSPKTVPSAPGSVAVSGTPGGVNVSWTPAAENGAAITRYTASAYTAATGGNPVGSCTTSNGSMNTCTIMRLQGGTRYFVDVVATNRAGNGAASTPRTAGTPGPGSAVSTYSKRKVTVRWDAPTPGSNTITGYTAKLYTKSKGGTKVGECSAAADRTSCTTKKMKKRSKYYIDLTMQSASGTFTVKPRIVTGPPKKASAPKVTSATPTSRKVGITWAPPKSNGYSYLKSYGARLYSKSKGGSVKASCSAGPSTTTCTTKTMKKGKYYSAVRVKNSKGWSSWSKRVKVVVR